MTPIYCLILPIELNNPQAYKFYSLRFDEFDINGNEAFEEIGELYIQELTFYENGTNTTHITCRNSASQMQIFINGVPTGTSGSDSLLNSTQNNANIYIGNKGGNSNYYTGSLSQINIHNQSLTNNQVYNHYISSDGSPYVGNIFYSNGIAAITHPGVEESLLANPGIGEMIIGENFYVKENGTVDSFHFSINKLEFQGSHLIYEHEYQCTLDEYEFNDTLNPSARKIRSHQSPDLADFATGSLFKPYITTVGLYNENNELLVVGKLGQPIRTSDETDTTLIVRWDT